MSDPQNPHRPKWNTDAPSGASGKAPKPLSARGITARSPDDRWYHSEEAEEILRAIRGGEVDALVVSTPAGDRIYTLESADRSYRTMVEAMAEGAVTVAKDGLILYGNRAFSRIMGMPLERVIGAPIHDFVVESDKTLFQGFPEGWAGVTGKEMALQTARGAPLPVSLSMSSIPESDPPAFCLVVTDLSEQKKRESELDKVNEGLQAEVADRRRAEEELRRVNQELREKEALLSSFYDNAPLMMGVVDVIGDAIVPVSGNAALSRFFGLPGEKVEAWRPTDVGASPVITSLWVSRYREAKRTGAPVKFEYLHDTYPHDARREPRWISATVACIGKGPEGHPRFCFIAEDRTEHKMFEEALRESEARFRTSIENMLDGFAVWTAVRNETGRIVDFRCTYINEAGCRINGWRREEAVGRMRRDLFPTHRNTRLFEEYVRLVETGEPIVKEGFDYEGLIEGQQRLALVLDYQAVKLGDGYAVVWRDVTAKKEAEAVLEETTRTLHEIVQAAPVGILVLDPAGKVLLWNPAMEGILGWTEGEVRGKLPPTVAAGQEGAKETLERLLAGEKLAGVELRWARKDGQPVEVRLWTAPIREEKGRHRNTIGIFLDVTRLKEMEQMALAQQKLASLGQVATGIAHEIRNPLSGINLYLHSLERLLEEAGILHPEIREKTESVIANMQGASTKMESVIQRVLAFSRPGPPRMEPLDINACIRDAVDMARISLQKAGARVAVAPREDLPLCRGDMRLIEQALLNLLTNAAQSMEKQEGERMIEISSSLVCSTSGNGYHVTVSVADSGPGIPGAVRGRIFDPFFTTKGSGTGIGLSITQKIVSDHGGFIRVGTSRWGGALFTIGLPASDKGENPDD